MSVDMSRKKHKKDIQKNWEKLKVEVNSKFISETKGVTTMGTKDLEDVIMLICEFINDIDSKARLMGYLDNLYLIYLAYEGKENIIPELNDLDEAEMKAITAKVAMKLELPAPSEKIAQKAFGVLAAGNDLRLAIEEAKKVSGPSNV